MTLITKFWFLSGWVQVTPAAARGWLRHRKNIPEDWLTPKGVGSGFLVVEGSEAD